MPDAADPVVDLIVNGVSYAGWKSISISRALEEFARSFHITYRDSWAERAQPVPINRGDSFRLTVDGADALVGWIEDVNIDYDAKQHELSAAGRSATGDLQDCTAVVAKRKSRRWEGDEATIRKIATDLCAPFGITVGGPDVEIELDAKLARPFALEKGEYVFDALSRLADLKGLLLQTTVHGDALFCRAGSKKVRTVLRYGDNIKAAHYGASDRDRFSHYRFRGQTTVDDNWNGDAAVKVDGFVEDQQIRRYRPFEVTAHTQADKKDLGRRAKWERNTRAGRSETLRYTVPGWRHADGIWSPNTLVPVEDPIIQLRSEMLISRVDLNSDVPGGYTTDIEVVNPLAYAMLETPKPKRKTKPKRSDFDGANNADIPRRNTELL